MGAFGEWKRELENTLERHIGDKAATAVAVSLISGSKAVEQVMRDNGSDPEVSQAVADLFVSQTVMLPMNPFWQARGGHIGPVATAATLSWFDGLQYAGKVRDDDLKGKLKVAAMRAYTYEIATAILLAVKGGAALNGGSAALRDDLYALDEKHKV